MEKIKMPHPIAELDGEEMTHVLWGKIKEQLILPFVELNTEYYDLGLPNRERTADQVTRDAAEAIRRLHIGVKCATITPNLQRQTNPLCGEKGCSAVFGPQKGAAGLEFLLLSLNYLPAS